MSRNGLFSVFIVEKILEENAHTRTLTMGAGLPSSPGQFVMAWLPQVGEKPFSISGNDPLSLTICDVGPVSHALNALKIGDRIWIRGPLGNGFELSGTDHVLVGGGYGAAPLLFLAKQARQQGHRVRVCVGAKTAADLLMLDKFRQIGCEVFIATEDGSAGEQGLVTSPLKQSLEMRKPTAVYACGPTGMLLAIGKLCQQFEVPAQLSFEALIRCGVGLCGSCELPEEICLALGISPGFLVCHDGPVAKMT